MSYNKSEHVTSRHLTNYENATVESSESTQVNASTHSNSSANFNGRNVRVLRSANKRKRSEGDLASVVADNKSEHVTNNESAAVESSESKPVKGSRHSNSSANLNDRNVRIVRSSRELDKNNADLAKLAADAMALSSSSMSKSEISRYRQQMEQSILDELNNEGSSQSDESDDSSTCSEGEVRRFFERALGLEEDNEVSSTNAFVDSFINNFKSEKFSSDKCKEMVKKLCAQIEKDVIGNIYSDSIGISYSDSSDSDNDDDIRSSDKESSKPKTKREIQDDSSSDSDSDAAPIGKKDIKEKAEVTSRANESSRLKRKKETHSDSDSDSDSDVEPRAKKYIKTTSEATLNDNETSIPTRKKEIQYNEELNELFEEILEKKPNGAVHFIAMFSTPENLERLIKKSSIDEINSGEISPLGFSLCFRREENAKILVQNGAALNWKDENQSTPLHMACKHGFTSLVEVMLERSADFDINAVDEEGRTPLYIALDNDKEECASILIDKGADAKIADYDDGDTPLHLACDKGLIEIAKKLIGKVDVNSRNNDGSTPLLMAFESKNSTKIVELLIESEGDIEAEDEDGNTPLLLAIKNRKIECVDLLIKKGAKIDAINKKGETALHLACTIGNLKLVKKFIGKIDIETRDNNGNTPIFAAFKSCVIDCVNFLKEKGAKIDVTNNEGVTSLHMACEFGLTEIMELLLEGNCDYNAVDDGGNGALHYAIYGESEECIDLIMKKGVDINRANKKGVTPLHAAAERGIENTVSNLIGLVDDIDVVDEGGNTPFLKALKSGYWEIASDLLKRNANINIVNKKKETPLFIACSTGKCPKDLFSEILEKTDNPNIADSRGFTPLHVALVDDDISFVRQLLAKGALITTKPGTDGESCLSLILRRELMGLDGSYLMAYEHFLKQDGNVDLYGEGEFQDTPLHFICKNRDTSTFEKLVEKLHAREFLKRNICGKLPLQMVFNNKDSAGSKIDFFSSRSEAVSRFILFTLEGCIKEHVPAITEEVQEKGLLGLSQYLEKNMQEFLDDAKSKGANPVESALILGDEILAKKMKDLLPKESYQNYVEELIKKFGPEAEEFFGALQFSYEINPVHMKDTAQIPEEKSEGVVIGDLLQMFEDSYKLNPDSLIPNELRGNLEEPIHDSLLKILKSFVNKVEKRIAYEGTPKNKEKLEIFYNSIEIALTHVIKKLQGIAGEEGQKRREEVLKTLLSEVENCGGKIFSISMDLYCQVVKGEVLDFETRLQKRLADLREVIFLSYVPSGDQNVHIKNYLMEKLGVELGIPGSEAAIHFEDSYADRTINHEEAKKGFLKRYNPYSIANFVQQQCREDREFKDLCLDWIVENIEIPAEWNRAWDELIQNKGVVSSVLEVKNMQEKMVKTLQLLGDIDWEDKKDLELSKKDIFKGCQEASIDPEVMAALLKKCGVFLDVESSAPVDEDPMELV